MSFFDDIDNELLTETVTQSVESELKHASEGNVGDVCYYDLLQNEFGLASSVDGSKTDVSLMDDWKVITMGIVLNQHEEDSTVDVLMCGFLMAEPLRLPVAYWHEEKRPYIRAYAYDMFRRYVKAFFRQCPGYEALLKLQITMPTVSDMLKVQQNAPDIFNTLQVLSKDDEKFDEYIARMYRNYIYVRHDNGRIYQMNINEDPEGRPAVIIPSAGVEGDFMCVFRHVDAFNKQKHNPEIT